MRSRKHERKIGGWHALKVLLKGVLKRPQRDPLAGAESRVYPGDVPERMAAFLQGLVVLADDWEWSSARWFAGVRPVKLEMGRDVLVELARG